MKAKTKEERLAEADKLRDIQPRVRRFSAFNDDNHAAIDAQVAVLVGDVLEDDIFEEFDGSVADEAQSAANWMNGESDEASLAESWAEIAA